jgi:SAM-dependent methyltransferase
LTPTQTEYYAQFITDYETVRDGEGRAGVTPEWYRALPFIKKSQRFHGDWRIRAASYQTLLKNVIQPVEKNAPVYIIDLGAGNGWLSNRLAERGHTLAAVDLLTNEWDGLGAGKHYETEFTRIQAPFDCLPLADTQADVVIYNGAFHYATDYPATINEALRVLKPQGHIVIVDTPVYHDQSSGKQMVKEREAHFTTTYGTASNSLPFQNYLTYDSLTQLGNQTGIVWQRYTPFYGIKWALRPIKARLRGHREPANFHVIVGKRA